MRHFVEAAGARYGNGSLEIDPMVIDLFRAHSWLGNIRELERTATSAALACLREDNNVIEARHLPEEIVGMALAPAPAPYKVNELLKRIEGLLQEHSPRSVSELVRHIGRNEDAVRRHAARLEKLGKVRIERRKGPPGMTLHLI